MECLQFAEASHFPESFRHGALFGEA